MKDLTLMTNIEDLRQVCYRNVPKMFYEYVDTGSWTQTTYRENRTDFEPIKFKQRYGKSQPRDRATRQKGKIPGYDRAGGFYGHDVGGRRDTYGARRSKIRHTFYALYYVDLLDRRPSRGRNRAVLVSALRYAR